MKSIRPYILVQANPESIQQGQPLTLSGRLYHPDTMLPLPVKKIFLNIISMKDGHTIWPVEVIRKNTSRFDIVIGTAAMKINHTYRVRVSNNRNFSPMGATDVMIKDDGLKPLLLYTHLALPALTPVLKILDHALTPVLPPKRKPPLSEPESIPTDIQEPSKDETKQEPSKEETKQDETKQDEIPPPDKQKEPAKQQDKQEPPPDEEPVREPKDTDPKKSQIEKLVFITQMDSHVCVYCEKYSRGSSPGMAPGEYDPRGDIPAIPVHPNCRCTYDVIYYDEFEQQFYAAVEIIGIVKQIEKQKKIKAALTAIKFIEASKN